MVADDQRGLLADGLGRRRGRDREAGHDARRGAAGSPQSRPTLSHDSARCDGANCSSHAATSATVVMGVVPPDSSQGRISPHRCCVTVPGSEYDRRAASRATGSIPRTEFVRNASSAESIGLEGRPHLRRPRSRLSRARSITTPRMTPSRSGPSVPGVIRRPSRTRKRFERVPSQIRPSGVTHRTSSACSLAGPLLFDPPSPVIERLVPSQRILGVREDRPDRSGPPAMAAAAARPSSRAWSPGPLPAATESPPDRMTRRRPSLLPESPLARSNRRTADSSGKSRGDRRGRARAADRHIRSRWRPAAWHGRSRSGTSRTGPAHARRSGRAR